MARCHANENFPLPVVEALRRWGHDVLTTQDAGQSGQAIPDDAVLRFAHVDERVLLTFNRKDFIRLHQAGQPHAGILACRFDADFSALAERIHHTLADAAAGRLCKVNRPAGQS
ncbi:MAG: DUF5615 family PIN-like protein [Betaproteobacteria bacterium]|nr:DUF5615 family PIN-like protein [Betaproteobacteria bacterium]